MTSATYSPTNLPQAVTLDTLGYFLPTNATQRHLFDVIGDAEGMKIRQPNYTWSNSSLGIGWPGTRPTPCYRVLPGSIWASETSDASQADTSEPQRHTWTYSIGTGSSVTSFDAAFAIPDDSEHMTRAEVDERLRECAALPANWDKYPTVRITPEAISQARAAVDSLRVAAHPAVSEHLLPANIVPLRNGGMQLEWYKGNACLEVEITPDGGMSMLYARPNGTTYSKVRSRNVRWWGIPLLVTLFLGDRAAWSISA